MAVAQSAATVVAEDEAASWKAYYQQRAADDYELTWGKDEQPLRLRSKAIVNWTNPLEQGQIHGSTFVWEHGGRPVVVGQLFSYLTSAGQRSYCHVFSTLTDKQVIGKRHEEVFWQPKLPEKTDWHAFKPAITPAKNPAGRRLQLRRLARQFEAYTEEASRGKRVLRLLPEPLYRSDATLTNYDSGLFAYVVGTDPELLILIETDLAQDAPVWRYRFVQSTQSTTVAALNGQEVYRYEKSQANPGAVNAVYLSRHGVETIPAQLSAASR
ncbi:hypothetical protein [Roseimaritima ulvae]|nr:hypothetical protein [Roseimaritima ulvae]